MDGLLFLVTICAVAFAVVRFIVEDGRHKRVAAPSANGTRASLLRLRDAGLQKTRPGGADGQASRRPND